MEVVIALSLLAFALIIAVAFGFSALIAKVKNFIGDGKTIKTTGVNYSVYRD